MKGSRQAGASAPVGRGRPGAAGADGSTDWAKVRAADGRWDQD